MRLRSLPLIALLAAAACLGAWSASAQAAKRTIAASPEAAPAPVAPAAASSRFT